MKKLLLVVLLMFCVDAIAGEHHVYTYEDEPVTPLNVVEKLGDMPKDLAAGLYKFLSAYPSNSYYFQNELSPVSAQNEFHMRRMIQLVDLVTFEMENFESYGSELNDVIQKNREAANVKQRDNKLSMQVMEVENMSKSGYIFRCPNAQNWLIKVASPHCLLNNLYASSNLNVFKEELLDADNPHVDIRKRATYQALSSAVINLVLGELVDNEGMDSIYVPKTYLHMLMDTDFSKTLNEYQPIYRSVNDSNSFVVQEYVPGLKLLSQNADLIMDSSIVTEEMASELKLCIEHGRLCNLKNKIAICMDDTSEHYKKLVLFGADQYVLTPNNKFTSADKKLCDKILKKAMNEMADLFVDRPDLVAVFQTSE